MTERKPMSPLARRIFASAEAHARANPHWGWTASDYLADDIKKLREEITVSRGASMTNDEGKPPVVHLIAADLVAGSTMASEPAPRKRAPRRRSAESLIKAAVKHGATVNIDDVTITPKRVEPEATPTSPLDHWLAKRGKQDAR